MITSSLNILPDRFRKETDKDMCRGAKLGFCLGGAWVITVIAFELFKEESKCPSSFSLNNYSINTESVVPVILVATVSGGIFGTVYGLAKQLLGFNG